MAKEELRAKLEAVGEIAIVGIGCRFPGGGNSPEEFWEMLEAGQSGIREIPADRWDVRQFFDKDSGAAGHYYCNRAGLLEDVAGFDAEFFGISPREAEEMDPQQRLLLELSWESLERAGILPEQIAGTDCGVYVGISSTDYGTLRAGDAGGIGRYAVAGASMSIAANRISHFFDLRGASLAIDTACSSSLVAIDEAVQAIRSGRIPMALVGGVNVLLSPYPFVGLSRAGMLSDYGECSAFSEMARGYVRAEGGGMVVLKPVGQALADGNPIYAIIRNSGVNNDGRTPGLSFPSTAQQENLLRQVYHQANLDPEALVYLEAHGTGTNVGDPAEAQAIGRAIGMQRQRGTLPIGSVKTNIGHLEAASGIAGLIKAIGILRRGVIPPSLHSASLNPDIPFPDLNLRVTGKPEKIRRNGGSVLVGVSSFGFGGTNAHVVLAEPPPVLPPPVAENSGEEWVSLPLSARSEASLREMANRIAALLETGREPLPDVAYSLALQRSYHPRRLWLNARNASEAAEAIRRYLDGQPGSGVLSGSALARHPGVALVFPGHGAQGTEEGRRLIVHDPLLAPRVRRIDQVVAAYSGCSFLQQLELPEKERSFSPLLLVQLVSFAIQAALAEALKRAGLPVTAVVGHSFGEHAAAWAAGALTTEQAVKIILARGETQEIARHQGVMAAAPIDVIWAERVIERYRGAIEIATVNSPSAVTFVGDDSAISDLGQWLSSQKIDFRRLDFDYAFHSRFLDPGRNSLLRVLADLKPSQTECAFYSSVTGRQESGESLNGEYWWRNLRERVRFDQAMASLIANGHAIFIEVGVHPIMQAYLRHSLRALNAPGQPMAVSVRPAENILTGRVADTLARAWLMGAAIDWKKKFPRGRHRLVSLPGYAWERKRCWFPGTSEASGPIFQGTEGRLLGARPNPGFDCWENLLSRSLDWLEKSDVPESGLNYPVSAFAELALEAARSRWGNGPMEIEELQLPAPLVFRADHARRMRTQLFEPDGQFSVESRPRFSEDPWELHARARVVPADQRALSEIPAGADVIEADLPLPDDAGEFLIHPAILENAFQLAVHAVEENPSQPLCPTRIGRLIFYRSPRETIHCRMRIGQRHANSLLADVDLIDSDGSMVACLRALRLEMGAPQPAPVEAARYHGIEFVPLELPGHSPRLPSPSVWTRAISLLPDAGFDLNELVGSLESAHAFGSQWQAVVAKYPDFLSELLAAAHGAAGIPSTPERVVSLLCTGRSARSLDRILEAALRELASGSCPMRVIRLLEVSPAAAVPLGVSRDCFRQVRVDGAEAWPRPSAAGIRASDVVIFRHLANTGVNLPGLLAQAENQLRPGGQLLILALKPGAWTRLALPGCEFPEAAEWRTLLAGAGLDTIHVQETEAGFLIAGSAAGSNAEIIRPIAPARASRYLIAIGEAAMEDTLGHDLAIQLAEAGQDVVFLFNEAGWRADDLELGFSFSDPEAWQKALRECAGDRPLELIYLNGLSSPSTGEAAEKMAWPVICLAQAIMAAGLEAPVLTLVTAGAQALPFRLALAGAQSAPHQAAVWGIARVLKNEHPDWRCRVIDLQAKASELPSLAQVLANEILAADDNDEVVLGADRRFGLRVRPLETASPGPAKVPDCLGLLKNGKGVAGLEWSAQPLPVPGRSEIQIEVRATGLNLHDVMLGLGALSEEAFEGGFSGTTLGMEGAGVIAAVGEGAESWPVGTPVAFFAPSSFSTHVVTSPEVILPLPRDMDFTAAATLPLALFTATYALEQLADLREGERVLIHGAAGAVGLAAIQLARHRGAEIFATAGTEEKRDLLRLYGLPPERIFDSRSLAFVDELAAATGGEGVDVVLNSLSGEMLRQSLGLLRPFGRFIELGKRDFLMNRNIGLRPFRNNLCFYGVDADQLLKIHPRLRVKILKRVTDLLAAGVFEAMPRRVFDSGKVVEAFRLVQHGEHLGKVVVIPPRIEEPEPANETEPLDSTGTYLILGGTSGLGLASAEVLADLGARQMILLGRSNLESAAVRAVAERLGQKGVSVKAQACDLAETGALRKLIENWRAKGLRVRGVIHAATVYADGPVATMTLEQFRKVMAVKAGAALELEEALAECPPDFVVHFSSMAAILGNPAQSNYAGANAVLDALAARSGARNQRVQAIAWGAISDIGNLSRETELLAAFEGRFGVRVMKGATAMEELRRSLSGESHRSRPHLMIGELQWNLPSLRSGCGVHRHSRFRDIAAVSNAEVSGPTDIRSRIRDLPAKEVFELTLQLLLEQIGEVLRIAPEKLDLEQSIAETGMDSLSAMELRILIEKQFGFELPHLLIREGITIRRLAERISEFLTHAAPVEDQSLEQMAARHGLAPETLRHSLPGDEISALKP